jgi:hypothetical protein
MELIEKCKSASCWIYEYQGANNIGWEAELITIFMFKFTRQSQNAILFSKMGDTGWKWVTKCNFIHTWTERKIFGNPEQERKRTIGWAHAQICALNALKNVCFLVKIW